MGNKNIDEDSSYNRYRGGVDSTDSALISRMREGKSDAWNRFAELYVPLIRYWCRKPGGRLTRSDRQDITQEVLAKVGKALNNSSESKKIHSFRGWLRTITENTISDFFEKNSKRLAVTRLMSDTGHFKAPYGIREPFRLIEEPQERLILLQQVLKTIEKEFRKEHLEIFHLLTVAEKTSSEVAEIMGIQAGSVRTIRSRILRRIRQEFVAFGIEHEFPEPE